MKKVILISLCIGFFTFQAADEKTSGEAKTKVYLGNAMIINGKPLILPKGSCCMVDGKLLPPKETKLAIEQWKRQEEEKGCKTTIHGSIQIIQADTIEADEL